MGRRKVMWIAWGIVGLYLVGRAIAELFLIDMFDPATYRDDWGGPSPIGVLLVHCLPGLIAAVVFVTAYLRRPSKHPPGTDGLRP